MSQRVGQKAVGTAPSAHFKKLAPTNAAVGNLDQQLTRLQIRQR